MQNLTLKYLNGFTIMEIMVVVIITGIMAAFAIPNYQESIRKAHERDAIRQLSILHGANQIYLAAEDEFFPGTNQTIANMNAGLEISLAANEMNFDYDRSATDAYTATFTWQENGVDYFTIQVYEDRLNNNNPCCAAGPCKLATTACP